MIKREPNPPLKKVLSVDKFEEIFWYAKIGLFPRLLREGDHIPTLQGAAAAFAILYWVFPHFLVSSRILEPFDYEPVFLTQANYFWAFIVNFVIMSPPAAATALVLKLLTKDINWDWWSVYYVQFLITLGFLDVSVQLFGPQICGIMFEDSPLKWQIALCIFAVVFVLMILRPARRAKSGGFSKKIRYGAFVLIAIGISYYNASIDYPSRYVNPNASEACYNEAIKKLSK
jgi:hypothetical protein